MAFTLWNLQCSYVAISVKCIVIEIHVTRDLHVVYDYDYDYEQDSIVLIELRRLQYMC